MSGSHSHAAIASTLDTDQKLVASEKGKKAADFLQLYPIQELSYAKSTSYSTFVVGNDPIINFDYPRYKVANGQIALIAIGGMRSVQIACELSNNETTPQIFLIDNSHRVIPFWKYIINIAINSNTKEIFLQKLEVFLTSSPGKAYYAKAREHEFDDINDLAMYHNQNIIKYFKELFARYEFSKVRAIFCNAIAICQNWNNKETFIQIKKIINAMGIPGSNIIVYASNVIPYMGRVLPMRQIVENICHLNPVFSIHSNLHPSEQLPTQIHLIDNHNDPESIIDLLCTNREWRTTSLSFFSKPSSVADDAKAPAVQAVIPIAAAPVPVAFQVAVPFLIGPPGLAVNDIINALMFYHPLIAPGRINLEVSNRQHGSDSRSPSP